MSNAERPHHCEVPWRYEILVSLRRTYNSNVWADPVNYLSYIMKSYITCEIIVLFQWLNPDKVMVSQVVSYFPEKCHSYNSVNECNLLEIKHGNGEVSSFLCKVKQSLCEMGVFICFCIQSKHPINLHFDETFHTSENYSQKLFMKLLS